MEYLKFDKNFRTERRCRILSVDYRQLIELNIDPRRLDYDSVKFLYVPRDIHIIACWIDYLRVSLEFLIGHEDFPRTIEGAEFERYYTKIVDCTRLIKLSWGF